MKIINTQLFTSRRAVMSQLHTFVFETDSGYYWLQSDNSMLLGDCLAKRVHLLEPFITCLCVRTLL